MFYILSRNAGYYYLNYSIKEVRDIVNDAVAYGTNDDVLVTLKNKDLYHISKNSDDEIEIIDYDSYLVNVFLKDVTDNVSLYLDRYENNPSSASFYIPFGSFFRNPILNGKGPKIPVRMESIGSVTSNINVKITEYGINNCLIEMSIHIEVTEKIILPVMSDTIKIVNDYPVSYKVIRGKVPTYYGNSISKNSGLYSMPMV